MPLRGGGGFSGPLSTIAVAGIALGVTVMIMAVSILRGFQADISGKVAGFGSHITLSSYGTATNYNDEPVAVDSTLADALRAVDGVRHVQCYANKGGMVKTEEQIYGIVFHGLDAKADTSFFASCLVEGRLPETHSSGLTATSPNLGEEQDRISSQPKATHSDSSPKLGEVDARRADGGVCQPSNDVLISSTIAAKLRLGVGDKMRTYFWQGDSYRARAFTVCGVYNTDLTEMDELYVVGDLRQVQRLNDWGDSLVGGYEILVDNFDRLDETYRNILNARRTDGDTSVPLVPYSLRLTTVRQANPALFSWLDLLNSNITLILTIMCVVCAVAIVSALLIMIFEKSATIGLLKALGANNASVRGIFMLKASQLIAIGIAIGDAIALALSAVQVRWQVLRLDPESYSMAHVPVLVDGWVYLLVSAATLAVCVAALLLPAASISKISPARTMRVE